MSPEMPPRSVVILMAEDNPTDVMLTREALANAGLLHTLHVVENGVEAMAFLRQQGKYTAPPGPEIILLDVNMPRKNGLEVLAEIKIDMKLKNIPVIILTTSGSKEDIAKAYASHADFYIIKPMDVDDFTQLVQSVQGFCRVVTLPMPSEH